MSPETAQAVTETSASGTFSGLINRLVYTVDRQMGPGEVAELRRLRPEQPGSPAFWKLVALHLDGENLWRVGGSNRDECERRWAVLFSAMAHGTGLHQAGARLGKALADAKFHELRLVRLLRATDDILLDGLVGTVRFLAAKGKSFDFAELAQILTSSGKQWGERVRRDIARSYYLNID